MSGELDHPRGLEPVQQVPAALPEVNLVKEAGAFFRTQQGVSLVQAQEEFVRRQLRGERGRR